jgi:hypothetical protein
MQFGDVVGLIVSMGFLTGIVAIIGQMYRHRLQHKERIAEIRAGTPAPAAGEASETIARLEHRIRVLERIATDKTATLASQIEDLREPAN